MNIFITKDVTSITQSIKKYMNEEKTSLKSCLIYIFLET